MNKQPAKTYWASPADRDGTSAADAGASSRPGPATLSRRRFLEAAGFTVSAAALGGCRRAAPENALPFVDQPVGVIPGRLRSYASTCAGCPAGCGLLVGVRDGRPLKMEGLNEHPLSRGGLCAVGQALPLGLYDSHRFKQPLAHGKPSSWREVDQAIMAKLKEIAESDGAVRFVTATVTSPTLKAAIDALLSKFKNARHITFDALSCSAILDAHAKTHQVRELPHYQFAKARVVVSFGADFLGTWISPVEFTAAWRSLRVPTADAPTMSLHVQLESRMSLTGSNADRRYRLAADEYAAVLSHLVRELAARAGMAPPEGELGKSPLEQADLAKLVDSLWNARGASLVVCDSQDVTVQMLVNAVNHYLGNYGKTLDIDRPSRQRQGNDAELLGLLDELKAGEVAALLVAGTDLSHNLPDRETLVAGIRKVPLVISFAEREDDLSAVAHFVCPDLHPLESWLDAEPVRGTFSLSQPTLRPLADTRSILESLARWSGGDGSAYDLIRETWKTDILPRVKASSFTVFWEQTLRNGFVETVVNDSKAGAFQTNAVRLPATRPAGGLAVTLYSKIALPDSRHAHNAWLQELPDPITKITWDNYVCVSTACAAEHGLVDGDMARVETGDGKCSVELPVVVQPGQHDRVLAIALGYGVKGTDRFADIGPDWLEARPTTVSGQPIGKNASQFIAARDGTLRYDSHDVKLTKTGQRRDLARTQVYPSMTMPPHIAPRGAEVREPIQETTLSAFTHNPHAGKPEQHHFGDEQLWPEDHPKEGHHWGMVIDLNACTGCSACLIACQSENNVPVVGKDEVRRRREMHWIRIDRYYSGTGDDVDVTHQPMMCHHCDNAPCETVCPVLATVHGDEGLNEQAYNRCVGTRYCANNCPYKVRRFNWFKYRRDDSLQNLALNPNVTVRTRGVMEKCSMCVQRIEEAKIAARRRGTPLADGEALTACQQSCPARAIVFGDVNDAASGVSAAMRDPRRYGVLEEFNFRPSVAYLRMVRNSDVDEVEKGDHV